MKTLAFLAAALARNPLAGLADAGGSGFVDCGYCCGGGHAETPPTLFQKRNSAGICVFCSLGGLAARLKTRLRL